MANVTPAPQIAALEFIEQGAYQHGTRRADGVTQGDGAAVDIHLVAVKIQVANEFLRDHREGFVDFPKVDILRSQPGFLQGFSGGWNRRIQHQRRRIAHIGIGEHARPRFQAMLGGVPGRGDQQGCRECV